MTGSILAINAGSSSVKFQLFADTSELVLLARGEAVSLGGKPEFSATNENTQRTDKKPLTGNATQETALQAVLEWIAAQHDGWEITAVAHRIVHGGTAFTTATMLTPPLIKKLKTLIPLAPLHQPHNLAAIDIIASLKKNVPQIACFDTAFHSSLTPLFSEYALPQKLREKGIRRYGFHGLSYAWVAHSLKKTDPRLAAGKVIAAHLGNGASLCAMHNGVSIDTTMGMTALDGLPMGTRSGALDPGAVIYMIRELGLSPDEAEHILYNECGLLGLSGLTNDMKLLQESIDSKAKFAIDYFVLKTAQFIGQMAVALGGVDAVIFTGGIGEHAARSREKILGHIEFLKPFEVRIIAANEERIMAMQARALMYK